MDGVSRLRHDIQTPARDIHERHTDTMLFALNFCRGCSDVLTITVERRHVAAGLACSYFNSQFTMLQHITYHHFHPRACKEARDNFICLNAKLLPQCRCIYTLRYFVTACYGSNISQQKAVGQFYLFRT